MSNATLAIPVSLLTLLALSGCPGAPGTIGELDDGGDDSADDGGSDGVSGTSGAGGESDGADDEPGTDDGPVPPIECEPDAGASRDRFLDPAKWSNAVAALTGVEMASGLTAQYDPFARVTMGGATSQTYANDAAAVATAVDIASLLPCDLATPDPDACVEQFITEFGLRAFRRPLSPTAVEAYAELAAEGTLDERGRIIVQAMLAAPNFWTIADTGVSHPSDPNLVALDDWAIATRLALLAWNSVPDQALLDRAAAGELQDPAVRVEELERLLADPHGHAGSIEYWSSLLNLSQLDQATRDPLLFPGWDDVATPSALRAEVAGFVAHVLDTEPTWDAMMHEPATVIGADLAALSYAGDIVGTPPSGSPELVQLDPARRGGLLTLAAPMVATARDEYVDISRRGMWLLSNFLCTPIPAPPPGTGMAPPASGGESSRQEWQATHVGSEPTCAACHAVMDPLTWGLDHYDPIGRWQAEILPDGEPGAFGGGFAVIDEGEVNLLASGTIVPYTSREELVDILTDSAEGQQCVVQQHLAFAYGRSLGSEDECAVQALLQSFQASDGDLLALLSDIVAADEFVIARP